MNNYRRVSVLFWLALVFALCEARASAAEPLRLEARLVWGTNEEKSPDPKHTAVDDALAKRLAKSLFKWKHYFQVNSVKEEIPAGQNKSLELSKQCTVEIKNLGDGRIEIKLTGDGKLVSRNTEPLPDDWPVILSGNASNDTAWLVVIQKIADKPKAK